MNTRHTLAHDYIGKVVERGATSMQPGFEPDWTDRPWRQKRYDEVVGFSCPLVGTSDSIVAATLTALREAIGVNGRRLRLTPNDDAPHLAFPEFSMWSRGAASGGGLYPVEAYIVTGSNPELLPGVYHYDAARHALDRLSVGDVSDELAAATYSKTRHSTFLIFTAKFWKNSFKYNELAYHVVTLDHGAALEAWRVAAEGCGAPHAPAVFSFDEATVNSLIGIDGAGETALSIVPVGVAKDGTRSDGVTRRFPTSRTENERSHEVHAFSQVTAVQREALGWVAADNLSVETFRQRTERGRIIPLPTREGMARRTALDSMRRRRSSFGCFSHDSLTQEEARRLLSVFAEQGPVAALADGAVSLVAIIRNVEGLDPAVYDVALDGTCLTWVSDLPSVAAMQKAYFLENYSLGAPAMTVLIIANPSNVISSRGPRGLRELNATVGAAAQRVYLAAAEIDVGCGVILGFDNQAFATMAGLDEEWVPLLIAMVGPEHSRTSEYKFTIGS